MIHGMDAVCSKTLAWSWFTLYYLSVAHLSASPVSPVCVLPGVQFVVRPESSTTATVQVHKFLVAAVTESTAPRHHAATGELIKLTWHLVRELRLFIDFLINYVIHLIFSLIASENRNSLKLTREL